jgi:hypothetical protein
MELQVEMYCWYQSVDLASAHQHRQNLRVGAIYEQSSFGHKMSVSINYTAIDQYLPIQCMEDMLAWFPLFFYSQSESFLTHVLPRMRHILLILQIIISPLERPRHSHCMFSLHYKGCVKKVFPMAGTTHLCNNVMNTTGA